ncbi:hypothetical protein MD484_g5155, partial [Candolleomyces efflorescens]
MSDAESDHSSYHSSACYTDRTEDWLGLPRLDAAYLASLYLDTASDQAIDAFLKKSKLYDYKKKHWTLVHEFPTSQKEVWRDRRRLDRSFITVIAGILRHFGNAGRSRKIEGGYELKMRAFKATGPSFELPKNKKDGATLRLGFTNIASFIDVEHDENYMEDRSLYMMSEHSEVYAREVHHKKTRLHIW